MTEQEARQEAEKQAAWRSYMAEHGYSTMPTSPDTGADFSAGFERGWQASRVVEAAPSDTDWDFKRIPAETRAELIHMAEGRIKDVWTDAPEGVDAATLASNVVAAQEFVWMQLAAGVDLRTSQPVQVEVTTEMVERAAKALHVDSMGVGDSTWEDSTEEHRSMVRWDARTALFAALGGGDQ